MFFIMPFFIFRQKVDNLEAHIKGSEMSLMEKAGALQQSKENLDSVTKTFEVLYIYISYFSAIPNYYFCMWGGGIPSKACFIITMFNQVLSLT